MTIRPGMTALLALLVVLAAPFQAAADRSLLVPVDEQDLLILEVHVERYLASRGLLGYHHGDQVLLPLGELAAVLEYAVHADVEQRIVTGWIISENRSFRLDVDAATVIVDGRESALEDPCLYVDADDIYVTSELLSAWWPLDLEVDLRGLRVLVKPRETVPLIQRLQREQAWSQRIPGVDQDLLYPRQVAPYRLATWPFLDATVSWQSDRRGELWRGSLLSRGDLARLSVTGFVGYEQQLPEPWTAWVRAGRSDREGRLLGPLAATSYEFGDVTSESQSLLGASTRGRGLALTNRPLGSVSQFDVIDVNGDGPPGWDVELYVNGTLHALQTVGSDGHYHFAEVPLRVGVNSIRAVMHGPHGQVREQVFTYNIRSGMWKRGHLHYGYTGLQVDESLVGARPSLARPENTGLWSHQLDVGYGLRSTTTLGATASIMPVDGEQRRYLQGRLLQSLGSLYLQALAIRDLEGGMAGSVSAQLPVGRQSLLLRYAQFDDFTSNSIEGSGDLKRRAESRLSGAWRPGEHHPISYSLRWQGEEFRDEFDLRRHYVDLYLGTSVRSLSLGHDVTYLHQRGAEDREVALGRLMVAGQLAGLRLRGDVDYDLLDSGRLRSVGLTGTYTFRPNLTGQIIGRHVLQDEDVSSVLGSLDWHLRPVRIGLRLGHDTSTGNSVGLSAATSLMRAPSHGSWFVTSQRLTQSGAAIVAAFVDHDQDGAFGPGDEPLAGVGFRRNPLWHDVRTDPAGHALLPGITPNQFVNVLVDLATIDDPYLVPVHEGMTTVVHPGGVVNLSFPFQYLGEIEGIVVRDSLRTMPVRSVGLELLDGNDERVSTAVSEFDGFYMFQGVLPGQYRVNVVESTLRGRRYLVPEPQPVTVPPGGDYVVGPTIYLLDPDLEPAPVDLAVEEPVIVASGDVGPGQGPGPGEGPGGAGTAPGLESGSATGTGSGPAASPAPSTPPPATSQPAPATPQPAPATPQPAPTTPRPTPEIAAGPSTAPSEARPTRPTPPTPPAEAPPAITPDVARTLHLIHELLFDSKLFAGSGR